jgi:fumarate reductase flavoprotein subunit
MHKEKAQRRLSRREFLKGAAAGAGALALVGVAGKKVQAHEVNVPTRWDFETDVAIVGSGGGMAAAIEALDAGAEVLVLEKMNKLGGETSMCAGVVYGAGTSVQRAAGIEDNPEEMVKYWMACAHGQAEAEVVKAIAYKSAETIEWLIGLGCEFPPEELYFSGVEREPEYAAIATPRPRGHHQKKEAGGPIFAGYILYRNLEKAARERGARILLETRALELVASEKNEVLGVKAESKGKGIFIRVKRGVILAAGGFSANPDMRKRYEWYGERFVGPFSFDSGDGIQMGQALGGDLINMNNSGAYGAGAAPVPAGEKSPISPAPRYPSIYVNKRGSRFANEDLSTYLMADLVRRQEDFMVFQVLDEDARKKVEPIPPATKSKLISAFTIRELAEKAGIDPARLEETIQRWNAHATEGKDPEFEKSGVTVGPIQEPPFYAYHLTAPPILSYSTFGGLRINAKAQVLDVKGKVIRRLYAIGGNTGGGFGRIYPGGGSAICRTLNLGRIAGENAASEKAMVR